ncbi:MAG: PTS sugar transporter subunit IIB [Lachnospiraceae bacterium]|nr:PTS sugar transporter subunit IIB [Lachnospiraceae bacterium]
MIVKEARMDDRLIHGQVVTTWVQQTQAKAILVADDAAAEDEFQKDMLKLACPAGIQLIVIGCEKAASVIAKDPTEHAVMVIVRNPESAKKMTELGFKPDHWTIGNITGRKTDLERKKILKYLLPTQKDADNIKAIADAGVRVTAQSVPSEKQYDCVALLEKAGLL